MNKKISDVIEMLDRKFVKGCKEHREAIDKEKERIRLFCNPRGVKVSFDMGEPSPTLGCQN